MGEQQRRHREQPAVVLWKALTSEDGVEFGGEQLVRVAVELRQLVAQRRLELCGWCGGESRTEGIALTHHPSHLIFEGLEDVGSLLRGDGVLPIHSEGEGLMTGSWQASGRLVAGFEAGGGSPPGRDAPKQAAPPSQAPSDSDQKA